MERKSSIHIEAGNLGYLFHNDRSKSTVNSIFKDEKNEYMNNAIEAMKIYRDELEKRTKAYTQRTGQKLNKRTITHLSAIVNLDNRHSIEDVKKVANYLEHTLGTKVFQIAIHRDEGHIDEEGNKNINYHAHLEFMGIDENGYSIRRKLTKKYLINLQSKVAEILGMQRGINYTKERKKRPKRLGTYEYKEHAKRLNNTTKELKKLAFSPVYVDKNNNPVPNLEVAKFFEKKANELEEENKQLKEELAKQKDLKKENKRLRELLKQLGAKRDDYAYLEQFIKDLKQRIKNKELTKIQLNQLIQEKEAEFRQKLQILEQENNRLKVENKYLENKVILTEQLADANVINYELQNFLEREQSQALVNKIENTYQENENAIKGFNLKDLDDILNKLDEISNELNKIDEELNKLKELFDDTDDINLISKNKKGLKL